MEEAWQRLERDVVEQGLCPLCGACAGLCPYRRSFKGRIVQRDRCNLDRGRCLSFCPRITFDPDQASRLLFGESYEWNELGTVRQTLVARATDPATRARAQYGGVVTALACFSLACGLADGVIATSQNDKALPEGLFAASPDEVAASAGSSYGAAPTLEAFNRVTGKTATGRLCIIGTPCQAQALANIRVHDEESRGAAARIGFVIGLFCTWAFSHEPFAGLLESITQGEALRKLDIPPPPAAILKVVTESREIDIPLDDVRDAIMPACALCIDMTAEFADISVGAAEGMEGWNTVIIRSEAGAHLFREAREAGVIEIGDLPEAMLDHLKGASFNKKKRGLANIVRKTGKADDLLYLKAPPNIRELIEEGTVDERD